jgi:hypothetical protein
MLEMKLQTKNDITRVVGAFNRIIRASQHITKSIIDLKVPMEDSTKDYLREMEFQLSDIEMSFFRHHLHIQPLLKKNASKLKKKPVRIGKKRNNLEISSKRQRNIDRNR